LATFVSETAGDSDTRYHLTVLALATLGSMTQIGSFQFMSRCPRWPWQVTGSTKASGREPKTGLGRVFNSKLGCIATLGNKCMVCMQPRLKL